MTTSSIPEMPLILRKENFGGIVFDPFDATMLQLDHEGFAIAKALSKRRAFFFSSEKRNFLRELKSQLHWDRFRDWREVPNENPYASKINVPVLSAPTLVDFQITDKCHMGCPHCYASSVSSGEHVPWEHIEHVVNQLHECGVCQLAIGGGEPLLHPQIIDLLRLCHEKGIVPNLTTGGMNLTLPILKALKRYCGAIGMSMEGVGEHYDKWRKFGFENFKQSIQTMKEHDIPTVLQITLSTYNFDQLDEITEFCLSQKHLYGVIFLAYKPVGRGETASETLSSLPADKVSKALRKSFKALSEHMRVGYDCCMTPGIAGVENEIQFVNESKLEGCSALRGSVGISSSLDVIPCTFTWQYNIGNLLKSNLADIWQSHQAESFRGHIQRKRDTNAACSGCSKQQHCHGGCPVMPLINCHNDHLGKPKPIPALAATTATAAS